MLEREFFSVGRKRIGTWQAIFLIGIVAGFVGAIIKIESDALYFSENEAATIISQPKSAQVLLVETDAPEVTLELISGGYVLVEVNDVGVTQIDIFDNDSLKISCFEDVFCAYKLPDGAHKISARAYDAAGNTGTAEISIAR